MKKFLAFVLTFVVICAMLMACNSYDSDEFSNRETPQVMDNATLVQLREYNETLLNDKVHTRIPKWLKRLLKVVAADIEGALKAISGAGVEITVAQNINGTVGTVTTVYYGISGAVANSQNAYNGTSTCTITDMIKYTTNQYTITKDFLLSKGDDVLFKDPTDTLINSISLPDSLEYLCKIGTYHNEIVTMLCNDGSDDEDEEYVGAHIRKAPFLDSYYGDIIDCLNSEDFQGVFSAASDIFDYCSSEGFDYISYNQNHHLQSHNVNDAYLLFMTALSSGAEFTADVIDIANQYISIIERNQDFSASEKEQFYAGLIVAVYSYEMWSHNSKLAF